MDSAITMVLLICQLITNVSAAVLVVVLWVGKAKTPNAKQNQRLDKLEEDMKFVKECLDRDNVRIRAQEDGNRCTQKAILALMSHAINGNDTEKLVKARDELEAFLIER